MKSGSSQTCRIRRVLLAFLIELPQASTRRGRHLSVPQVQDFYDLLGVSRNASAADVRWAYERALNRANRDGAHKLMTELSLAYDTLSDPRRRSTYDRHGVPALRERSPGAAPLPPPWRIVKESPLPGASYSVVPVGRPLRQRGRWRVPTLAVFCLGVVAGLVLALQLADEPDVARMQAVVCGATPAGAEYRYSAPLGQPPVCTNGAVPHVTAPG